MATYESYKDSGVKWLGQIPSHWEVKKLRAFLSEVCESNSALKVHNQLQFKYGTIVPKPDTGVDDAVLKTISKYTVVNPGDIIINGLNLNYDFISFRVGKVNEQGVITSAYIAMRPNNGLSPKFYEYMLKAMDAKKVFHGFGTGIRATLSYKELKHKLLPLVPLNEQEAIVAYLDKVTGDIDRAIEAQQKMIGALNERKQIIITRAVTRGLNPDTPLRDSGIDWLGQIPEHWEVSQLKRFASLILGKMLDTKGGSATNWSRYICAKDVHFDGVDTSDLKSMYFSAKEQTMYRVVDGDVLIVEGGAGAGGCAIAKNIPENTFIQNSIIIIRPKLGLNKEYIAYLMQSFVKRGYIEFACNKATIPHFTKEKVGRVPISVPPIEEQKQIVSHINSIISPIEDSIGQCERMISLLQERKQIIINKVVTGKTKVI